MMDRIWRSRRDSDHGFSLVELLIVIIIMGILAAVAIPMFLSQREKAQDGATKSDVETLGKELVTWFVDHNSTDVPNIVLANGAYYMGTATDPSSDAANKVGNASPNVQVSSTAQTGTVTLHAADGTNTGKGNDWCVTLYNPEGKTKTFAYSSAKGLTENNCTGTPAGGSTATESGN
ncbi:MAG: prepilin-type N-terminal cleavage/methylation domain-containing protein [Bifidobacteriaceae bacterium]|jgi:prepilin-type N-terminal cleavage/methylation domain-containing protein|nr:prepilin-type N-terminal cleavage/methylation domain-containing protein [Bifidobacteriaceae bacterium]